MSNFKSKYTDDQLIAAIRESISFSEVLRKLGMFPKGGNFLQLKKRLSRLPDCDTSHLYGKRHGTTVPTNKKELSEVLVENSYYSTKNLKRRLISVGLLKNECQNGHPVEWMGKKLSLHLDHINGVNTDNRLENLRLLCPNCHSLTETYCRGARRKATGSCLDCGKQITKGYDRCGPCDGATKKGLRTKIIWPEATELFKWVNEKSYASVAREIGVTDNTIRKHLRGRGFDVKKVKKQ